MGTNQQGGGGRLITAAHTSIFTTGSTEESEDKNPENVFTEADGTQFEQLPGDIVFAPNDGLGTTNIKLAGGTDTGNWWDGLEPGDPLPGDNDGIWSSMSLEEQQEFLDSVGGRMRVNPTTPLQTFDPDLAARVREPVPNTSPATGSATSNNGDQSQDQSSNAGFFAIDGNFNNQQSKDNQQPDTDEFLNNEFAGLFDGVRDPDQFINADGTPAFQSDPSQDSTDQIIDSDISESEENDSDSSIRIVDAPTDDDIKIPVDDTSQIATVFVFADEEEDADTVIRLAEAAEDENSGVGVTTTTVNPIDDEIQLAGRLTEPEDPPTIDIDVVDRIIEIVPGVSGGTPNLSGPISGSLGSGVVYVSDGASSPCDDDVEPAQPDFDGLATSAISAELASSMILSPPREFIFDDRVIREDYEPVTRSADGRVIDERQLIIQGLAPFHRSHYKRNLMIPQQFYFNDIMTPSQNYVIRSPQEQMSATYNFGLDISSTNYDNFRYVLGGVYDHNSIVDSLLQGNPATTALLHHPFLNQFEDVMVTPTDRDFDRLAIAGIPFLVKGFESARVQVPEFGEPENMTFSHRTDVDGLTIRADRVLYRNSIILVTNKKHFDNFVYSSVTTQQEKNNWPVQQGSDLLSLKGYLRFLIGPPLKRYYDHMFQAPVGFSPYSEKLYRDYVPDSEATAAASKNLVKIDSIIRQGPEGILPTNDSLYSSELAKVSVYRRFMRDFVYNMQSDILARLGDDCAEDPIQKFPAHTIIEFFSEIDDLMQNAGERYGAEYYRNWVNIHAPVCNVVNIKMQHLPEQHRDLDQSDGGSPRNQSGTTSIADKFYESAQDITFFEMIDQLSPFNTTYYTQILDNKLNSNFTFNRQLQDDRERRGTGETNPYISDLSSIGLLPGEFQNVFETMETMLLGQNSFYHRPPWRWEVDLKSYPLGPTTIEEDLEDFFSDTESYFRNSLYAKLSQGPNSLKSKITSNYLLLTAENQVYESDPDHVGPYARTWYEMFMGKPAYSEVLAYKVVKKDASTNEIIQEFYFMNSSRVDEFNFYDSQVIAGKTYIYEIFTINFVVGTEYSYSSIDELSAGARARFIRPSADGLLLGARLERYSQDDNQTVIDYEDLEDDVNITSILSARLQNNVRIIEAPYYKQTIETILSELPPLYPNVEILNPSADTEDADELESTVLFRVSPRLGEETEIPIMFLEEDSSIINSMIQRQLPSEPSEVRDIDLPIRYGTTTTQTRATYEMYYLIGDAPRSYLDFQNAEKLIASEEIPHFNVSLPINQHVYIIFRSVNQSGISNPSPVFEYINEVYGDGQNTSFEIYEMGQNLESTIYCERLISIAPSVKNVAFSLPEPEEGQEIFSSVPSDIDQISLGPGLDVDQSIWNKKYKFRFKSATTGNCFDLNAVFSFLRMEATRSTDSRRDAICTPEQSQRIQRRQDNQIAATRERENQRQGFNPSLNITRSTDADPDQSGYQ